MNLEPIMLRGEAFPPKNHILYYTETSSDI